MEFTSITGKRNRSDIREEPQAKKRNAHNECGLLNKGGFEELRTRIVNNGITELDLTDPSQPDLRLDETGVRTLADLLRDPSVHLQKLTLGHVAGFTTIAQALPSSSVETLDLGKMVVVRRGDDGNWGRATLQDRHIKLLGKFFSLQHERSYFRRLVVNTERLSPDATDAMKDMLASAQEKGINVEQVCDPSVFEFEPLVNKHKPASPQADLCHRLNRGESAALLFQGHCDFAAGREAVLNADGMGTLVACLRQAASPPHSLKLEMVEKLKPLLNLNGSLLPAVLDLSRIVLSFGSDSEVHGLSDDHANKLKQQINEPCGTLLLNTLRIDASRMSDHALEGLAEVCKTANVKLEVVLGVK